MPPAAVHVVARGWAWSPSAEKVSAPMRPVSVRRQAWAGWVVWRTCPRFGPHSMSGPHREKRLETGFPPTLGGGVQAKETHVPHRQRIVPKPSLVLNCRTKGEEILSGRILTVKRKFSTSMEERSLGTESSNGEFPGEIGFTRGGGHLATFYFLMNANKNEQGIQKHETSVQTKPV